MPNQFTPNPRREEIIRLLHLKLTPGEIAKKLGIERNVVTGVRWRTGGTAVYGSTDKKTRGGNRVGLDAPVMGGANALAKVQRGECVYPLGNPGTPGFRFCRKPRSGPMPYCKHHAEKCYMKSKPRPDAGIPLRREWIS